MKFIVGFLTYLCWCSTESARILGVFYPPSYSHFTLSSTLMKELAARGHEVTMISPYPQKKPLKNYRDIELTGFVKEFEDQNINFFDLENANAFLSEIFINMLITNATENVLKVEAVQELLKSDDKFDVVILEDFINHALKGFCYYYDAHCIMFSSIGLSKMSNEHAGNPISPSYISDFTLPYGCKMNFFQRLHNSVAYVFTQLYSHLYVIPQHNRLLQQYFPGAPDLREIYYNVSLVFLNSHVSTHQAVPLVPNMIEIGGFHLKPSAKLPKDLQEYLDSAKEGAIYFSMGSNLKSIDMPLHIRKDILKVFSKLKQKVLWKWEDQDLPEKPDNVRIGKWLPQPDILAHPNVKLFITHGGLLSTMEAVYHGIPILGIPIYGDQKMNLDNAIKNGIALSVPYSEITEQKLFAAVKEILKNSTYNDNAKRLSKIMADQPMKPLDKAVFWVDYVIRHNGAPHLRSAALNLTWYQYLLLDVALFFFTIILAVFLVLYISIRKICCKKASQTVTKGKKTN